MGLVFCSRRGYAAWMRIAVRLQSVVTAVLFGLCYLAIAPFFAIFAKRSDPLRMRRSRRDQESFWLERRPHPGDSDAYERMG